MFVCVCVLEFVVRLLFRCLHFTCHVFMRNSWELQQHDCKDFFAQVQVARSSLGHRFLTLPKNGLMMWHIHLYGMVLFGISGYKQIRTVPECKHPSLLSHHADTFGNCTAYNLFRLDHARVEAVKQQAITAAEGQSFEILQSRGNSLQLNNTSYCIGVGNRFC